MKKRRWLCLLMVGAILTGCNNASTFDFNEFVDQYPTTAAPQPTEPVSVVPQEIETMEQEDVRETLFKQTMKIKLKRGKDIVDVCVSGDMVAYLVEDSQASYVYLTSLYKGGEELIYQTTENYMIFGLNSDGDRIIWESYSDMDESRKICIYEKGEYGGALTTIDATIDIWENVCGVTNVDIDGDYIFGYLGSFHAYTYNMVTNEFLVKYSQEEMDNIMVNSEKLEYIMRPFENGYGVFVQAQDGVCYGIKCVDVYGNVVYEKKNTDELIHAYSANENMIVSENVFGNKVNVECVDGNKYDIAFIASDVLVNGDWVFMFNVNNEKLRVFNPHFLGMFWEMDVDNIGVLELGDNGQIVSLSGAANEAIITVYTMN